MNPNPYQLSPADLAAMIGQLQQDQKQLATDLAALQQAATTVHQATAVRLLGRDPARSGRQLAHARYVHDLAGRTLRRARPHGRVARDAGRLRRPLVAAVVGGDVHPGHRLVQLHLGAPPRRNRLRVRAPLATREGPMT
jgi:hypothetical protein